MKWTRLTVRHLGPFDEVSLNLAELPGKLIAITGDNGAGKSTLLELLPGALYRSCPTRGALVELATARDAFAEVELQNGSDAKYVIRQRVDAISKKGEATVELNGQPVIASTKVRDADAWVSEHLPSEAVLYASSFLAQGSAGFLELSAADRKRVLLRLLQIERYEAMAERARQHARDAKLQVQLWESRLADTERHYPNHEECQRAERDAERAVEDAQTAQRKAQAAYAQAVKDQAKQEQLAAARTERAELYERVIGLDRDIAAMRERYARCEALSKRRDEIVEASAKRERLQAECAAADQKLLTARSVHAAAEAAAQVAKAATEQARVTFRQASERLRDAKADLQRVDELRALADALPERKVLLAKAKSDLQALQERRDAASAFAAEHQGKRIEGLRSGLKQIASRQSNEPARRSGAAIATEALKSDDALAKKAKSAPAAVAELGKRMKAQEAVVARANVDYQDSLAADASTAELKKAEKKLAKLQADVDAAKKNGRACSAAEMEAVKAREIAYADMQAKVADARELAAALAQLKVTDTPAALETAEAVMCELAPQLMRMEMERNAAVKRRDALPLDTREPAQPTVEETQRVLAQCDQACAQAAELLAFVREQLRQALVGVGLRADQQKSLKAARDALADWQRLGRDLGKDGLQALEIDAAVPELTTLTNDLLHTCHGARFSVQLSTQALSADGKRTLEALDIRVIDTHGGRDALAETFSGGERVVIGEALSLALTMLACRRAGLREPTLVRDESGAALDPENGRAYVAMLRRAAELLRADKVLFVTHNPELQELADARVRVAENTVEVLS